MMDSLPLRSVIMAGGSGTRFWPRSRRGFPKQFLEIAAPRSLLEETYRRVLPLSGPRGVLVVTAREHLDRVREHLPALPASNAIGEPVGRDTAACIGLAAEWLASSGDGRSIMLVCPSDHVIRAAELFGESVRAAALIAQRDGKLVTLGIPPRSPSSAFGYIRRGEEIEAPAPAQAYAVRQFVEKPDRGRAEGYIGTGEYYWNAGIFVWTVAAIRGAIRRFFPELGAGLDPMARSLEAGEPIDGVLDRGFAALAKNSIDRGVLEKAAAEGMVAVVEAPFDWDDVGSWNALEAYLPADAQGNHTEGRHLGLDTADCIIASSKRRLVATIGVRDLVIVDTDDAVLICPRDQVERVKELVARLESSGEGRLA